MKRKIQKKKKIMGRRRLFVCQKTNNVEKKTEKQLRKRVTRKKKAETY